MTLDEHVAVLERTLTAAELELQHLRLMHEMTTHCLAYLHCMVSGLSPLDPITRLAETAPRLLAVWAEMRGGKQ